MDWTTKHIKAKPHVRVLLWILASTCVFGTQALGFVGTEDEQFRVDLEEAAARAKDFDRTLKRIEAQANENEKYGYEHKAEREREDARKESIRLEFIQQKSRQPREDLERERLEQEYEKEKAREEAQAERDRLEYVAKRERVRRIMERDAFIDEAREYGL